MGFSRLSIFSNREMVDSNKTSKYLSTSDFEKQHLLNEFDFVTLQKKSWQNFLDVELKQTLSEFFPIEDYTKRNYLLELIDVRFGDLRYPLEECIDKKLTYQFPVYATLKLISKRKNYEKVQDVYLFSLPKMTEKGTFVINGIERAVISQIARSPGVYFSAEVDKSTAATVYNAEIRPYVGAWLDFTINKHNQIEAKINKKRRFYATSLLRAFKDMGDGDIVSLFSDVDKELVSKYIIPTLEKDPAKDKDEALLEIYKKLRPGEPLVVSSAYEALKNLLFDQKRYTLSQVGRYKINKKLGLDLPIERQNFVLTMNDIISTISYLIKVAEGVGDFDDIDHLSNRRVKTVGELVAMYGIRVGMVRVERDVKTRMSMIVSENEVAPMQVMNSKALTSAINTFFKTSQLSTIVDQTNPVSEIDNLRRLTVAGPGGLVKERASFSIRDISASQYSRICPIRSPEGPNIGVVTYMAMYSKLNEYGFLEAPYRKVILEGGKPKVTNELVYLQADDEENKYITLNNIKIDSNGFISQDRVPARYNGALIEIDAKKIDLIDCSPRQVVGLAAALVPFLQHDDASRALMGTHMICQAVPTIHPAAPVVGTGMEATVAKALGRTITATSEGVVTYVDGDRVEIQAHDKEKITHHFDRYNMTNKGVVFDQKPVVSKGQKLSVGDVIADGPATDGGRLAVGQNLVVAYTALDGLGYEDGFVLSERLVKQDVFTNLVMEEFIADLIDTKLGPEEITRDIPNVREEILANLDATGLVTVGTEVKPGDVLVGKVAPKGEKELSAEERLLRAIFGEKAKDVKDTSLRMPYGKKGIVTSVKIIDAKTDANELDPGIIQRIIVRVAGIRPITVGDKLAGRHGNKGIVSKILPEADMPYLEDGTPVDVVLSPVSVLARMNLGQLYETLLGAAAAKRSENIDFPVFDNVDENAVKDVMVEAGLPIDGKVNLYDGRTGKMYEKPVLVGIGYFMKLVHMVEDKFHARSTGPYSLVTQQPLGGKAQMGGQRFGEMEVWALESHRVPYVLQEMLTIKSDDVQGRRAAFEALIKGLDIPASSVPESFNVLVKELNSLSLSIEPVK